MDCFFSHLIFYYIVIDITTGFLVKMDVREDEEQSIKCQEVMELFLTAGYFRARIKVSSFL